MGRESGFLPAVQTNGRPDSPFVGANLRAMAWRERHSSSPDAVSGEQGTSDEMPGNGRRAAFSSALTSVVAAGSLNGVNTL